MANDQRQTTTTAPPAPPSQGQEKPCEDEEEGRGQKAPTADRRLRSDDHAKSTTAHRIDRSGSTKPQQLAGSAKGIAGKGPSASNFIPWQRHHPLLNGATRRPTPTIYRPETQDRGSSTLPPPKRPAEREGTTGLAGGEVEKRVRLAYRPRG